MIEFTNAPHSSAAWHFVHGEISPVSASFWLIPPNEINATDLAELADRCTLEGPFSERSRTLTERYRFRVESFNGHAALKALIPEPTLWTPAVPATYCFREIGSVNRRNDAHFAFRELVVWKTQFVQQGRPWR